MLNCCCHCSSISSTRRVYQFSIETSSKKPFYFASCVRETNNTKHVVRSFDRSVGRSLPPVEGGRHILHVFFCKRSLNLHLIEERRERRCLSLPVDKNEKREKVGGLMDTCPSFVVPIRFDSGARNQAKTLVIMTYIMYKYPLYHSHCSETLNKRCECVRTSI